MRNLRLFTSALALASFITVSAQSVVPGPPSLSMSYEIENDEGKIVGTVTAPKNDSQWQALPEDTKIDIRVVRSCYALSESDVAVFSITDAAPGQSFNFTDSTEPAWQYGYQYTYQAFAKIGDKEGYQGYGSCEPGIQFAFAYNTVTATPGEENGAFFVTLSALVPDKTSSWPAEPLEIDMTALEFYRITDKTTGAAELIGSIPDPEKGKTYTFRDEHPVANVVNTYQVKCVSKFGAATTRAEAFVGFDVPAAPYPVRGETLADGGYRIFWTAPDTGLNSGAINTEDTFYNIYRVWGRAADEREQIAADIRTTEYTDYGTDMEFPRAVMYQVEAANSIGTGGSSSSSYDYDVVIGPEYQVPFIETFDGGASKIWTFEKSSYYAGFEVASYAEYGDTPTRVEPASGTGLACVDFSLQWIAEGSEASMTSYKIDLRKSAAPWLAFDAYQVPGCDVTLKVLARAGSDEFAEITAVGIGECEEAAWKHLETDLGAYAGKDEVEIRFLASFTSKRGPAIIDEIRLVDYPAVGNISVDYDTEACSASLTWENPSTEYAVATGYRGIVDGSDIGAVEMPWIFKAGDYRTPYVLAVRAVYGDIQGPASDPVTVSVPRPEITGFTTDNHVYTIVKGDTPELKQVVISQYLGNDALYHAPQNVKYDDISYTVIGIGEGAYRGNSSLASVNLPETIATVGKEAFCDCASLMAVSFGTGLEKIESRAFAGCRSLTSVTFVSETLPEVAADAFSGIADNCTGKCPEGMADSYASVEGLAPINFGTSGVNELLRDAESVEYYDLGGMRISKPEAGRTVIIRIRMADGTLRTLRAIAR